MSAFGDKADIAAKLLTLMKPHAPPAGQIEVCSSKHIIGYLSDVAPALIGSLPMLKCGFTTTTTDRSGDRQGAPR
jgi:hypothetical protein